MGKTNVWYDEEGDFLEVTFATRKGSFRDSARIFTNELIRAGALSASPSSTS